MTRLTITAHGALSYDCKLILVDGKQVELGMWQAAPQLGFGTKRPTRANQAWETPGE